MDQDVVLEMQAQLCMALANAVRLKIIRELKQGPMPVNAIAGCVGLNKSTVSRHLAILRAAGVVTAQRKGTEVYYENASPKIIEVCESLRAVLAEQSSHQLEILSLIQE